MVVALAIHTASAYSAGMVRVVELKHTTKSAAWETVGMLSAFVGGWGLYPLAFVTGVDLLFDDKEMAFDFPELDWWEYELGGFVGCVALILLARFSFDRSWNTMTPARDVKK